jgi:hypothetical protein
MRSKNPITEHEFYNRFYACSTSRSLFHWLPFHQCARSKAKEWDRLHRLPKRVFSIIDESDDPDEFWGLLAREKPAMLRILLYHASRQASGFALCGCLDGVAREKSKTQPFP